MTATYPQYVGSMLRCRALGHRWRFAADGSTMRWTCARGCGAQGEKRYPSGADAERYARAFDHEEGPAGGPGTPLSVLPLRLLRAAARRLRPAAPDD